MNEALPLVSVVIPTRNRPHLLLERALRSALTQTLGDIEVIVVVDGPDPATLQALDGITDPRLRVVALPENLGGAEARNVGLRHARAEWVALLDDDDEWLPHKLALQLDLAESSSLPQPIIVCHWIARVGPADCPQPVRLPDPGERLCDYLLAPKRPHAIDCSFMSTLILTRRALLLQVPFTRGLPRHQDTDWLLRVAGLPGVGVEFVPEIAAVWYSEEGRDQMSRRLNWRWSLSWAQAHWRAGRLSNRAYAGFIIGHLAPHTQRHGEWQALWPLFRELVGRAEARETIRYLGLWALPVPKRRAIREVLRRQPLQVARAPAGSPPVGDVAEIKLAPQAPRGTSGREEEVHPPYEAELQRS